MNNMTYILLFLSFFENKTNTTTGVHLLASSGSESLDWRKLLTIDFLVSFFLKVLSRVASIPKILFSMSYLCLSFFLSSPILSFLEK